MKKILTMTICVLALSFGNAQRQTDETATPRALVDTYNSLADMILAAKPTEWNLVHSILGATYSNAENRMERAMMNLDAGKDASAQIEAIAALVAQLGNEGDASVAAVRKRLIEGGHHHHSQGGGPGHHNAKDDEPGEYDPGFVIITRASKKVFLDAASRIGKLGASASKKALQAEWDIVRNEFAKLPTENPMGK